MKPDTYAIVIGSSDKEHGPRLVSNPLMKIITKVNGLGDSNPRTINCSPLWARSAIASSILEIGLNYTLFKFSL